MTGTRIAITVGVSAVTIIGGVFVYRWAVRKREPEKPFSSVIGAIPSLGAGGLRGALFRFRSFRPTIAGKRVAGNFWARPFAAFKKPYAPQPQTAEQKAFAELAVEKPFAAREPLSTQVASTPAS